MSHKLTSSKSVVYNAQTLESSYLVITCPQATFVDNGNNGPFGGGSNEHTVNINGVVWANYSGSNQQRVDGMNYNLTDVEWDTFFSGSTLTSTGSYSQIQEASLLYIKANVPVMFGISSSNWIYSN
jgi:hypothetical protein